MELPSLACGRGVGVEGGWVLLESVASRGFWIRGLLTAVCVGDSRAPAVLVT